MAVEIEETVRYTFSVPGAPRGMLRAFSDVGRRMAVSGREIPRGWGDPLADAFLSNAQTREALDLIALNIGLEPGMSREEMYEAIRYLPGIDEPPVGTA